MKPASGIVFHPEVGRILLGMIYHQCTGNLPLFSSGPFLLQKLALKEMPGNRWVRVRCRLAGICGTDLRALRLAFSRRSAAVAEKRSLHTPVCMGHEAVGEVVEIGPRVRSLVPGQRVVLMPDRSCLALGTPERCAMCERGLPLLCLKRDEFLPSPDLGAGWSEQFLRHENQLFAVPDDISDEQAVLIEPLSCAIHAVLRRPPAAGDTVLVIGCGMIGLGIIASLKAQAKSVRVLAIAKHSYQVEKASAMGADLVLESAEGDLYHRLASALGTEVRARGSRNRLLRNGADIVYDAVGSSDTLQDALRWTKPRGAVVMEGFTSRPSPADCTPIWFREIDLIGSHGYGIEHYQGRKVHSFELAIEWIRQGKLRVQGLITHRHPLLDYKQAIRAADGKPASKATKVVLEMGNS